MSSNDDQVREHSSGKSYLNPYRAIAALGAAI